MIINEIVNEYDMAAVRRLIDTHNQVAAARATLRTAEANHASAAHRVTEVWSEDKSEECVVLEDFCIEHRGDSYLITIDMDGDHGHTVKRVYGIYLEALNG
jgi:hypothetical protein